MNIELKENFVTLWKKYFGDAELPIVFFYTYADGGSEWAEKPGGWNCIICELAKVRNGKNLVYNADRVTCGGGWRYLGYTEKMIGFMEESFLITDTWSVIRKRL